MVRWIPIFSFRCEEFTHIAHKLNFLFFFRPRVFFLCELNSLELIDVIVLHRISFVRGCLSLVPTESIGSPSVPLGLTGSTGPPPIPVGLHRCHRVPTDSLGVCRFDWYSLIPLSHPFHWVFTDSTRTPSIPLSDHRLHWVSTDSTGTLPIPLGPHRFRWVPTIPLGPHRFHWVPTIPLGHHRLYRVPTDSAGSLRFHRDPTDLPGCPPLPPGVHRVHHDTIVVSCWVWIPLIVGTSCRGRGKCLRPFEKFKNTRDLYLNYDLTLYVTVHKEISKNP